MLCAHSHRHAPDAVQTRADGPCRIERSTGTVKKVGSERRGGREEEKVREERREADAPPDSSRPLLLQQQPQRPMPILPILTEIRRRAFCASASWPAVLRPRTLKVRGRLHLRVCETSWCAGEKGCVLFPELSGEMAGEVDEVRLKRSACCSYRVRWSPRTSSVLSLAASD